MGKSSLARWVHSEVDCASVVVDYAGAGGYRGVTVSTLEELREQVGPGGRAVVSGGSPVPSVSAAMAYAKAADHPVQVVVEEAESAAKEGDPDDMTGSNPVWWGLKRGRGHGVKVVLVEQDPSDIPYTPLKSVPYIAWVGEPAGFHNGFLNHSVGNWIPKDRLPERAFRYVVLHKSGRVVFPAEGTAETPGP